MYLNGDSLPSRDVIESKGMQIIFDGGGLKEIAVPSYLQRTKIWRDVVKVNGESIKFGKVAPLKASEIFSNRKVAKLFGTPKYEFQEEDLFGSYQKSVFGNLLIRRMFFVALSEGRYNELIVVYEVKNLSEEEMNVRINWELEIEGNKYIIARPPPSRRGPTTEFSRTEESYLLSVERPKGKTVIHRDQLKYKAVCVINDLGAVWIVIPHRDFGQEEIVNIEQFNYMLAAPLERSILISLQIDYGTLISGDTKASRVDFSAYKTAITWFSGTLVLAEEEYSKDVLFYLSGITSLEEAISHQTDLHKPTWGNSKHTPLLWIKKDDLSISSVAKIISRLPTGFGRVRKLLVFGEDPVRTVREMITRIKDPSIFRETEVFLVSRASMTPRGLPFEVQTFEYKKLEELSNLEEIVIGEKVTKKHVVICQDGPVAVASAYLAKVLAASLTKANNLSSIHNFDRIFVVADEKHIDDILKCLKGRNVEIITGKDEVEVVCNCSLIITKLVMLRYIFRSSAPLPHSSNELNAIIKNRKVEKVILQLIKKDIPFRTRPSTVVISTDEEIDLITAFSFANAYFFPLLILPSAETDVFEKLEDIVQEGKTKDLKELGKMIATNIPPKVFKTIEKISPMHLTLVGGKALAYNFAYRDGFWCEKYSIGNLVGLTSTHMSILAAVNTLFEELPREDVPKAFVLSIPIVGLSKVEEEVVKCALKAEDLELVGAYPKKEDVLKILNSEYIDVVHLIGHGKYEIDPLKSGIVFRFSLAGEDTVLDGSDILTKVYLRGHPVVFVNACKTAKIKQTLEGVQGLVSAFLTCGARNYLGTLWSVDDDTAENLAREFYGLVRKLTVGEALKESKKRTMQKLDGINWMAYILFGDPTQRISSKG